MVHRLALLLGGVGAAAVLAVALGLGGLMSATPIAADAGATIDRGAQPAVTAPDTTKTVIDKVYIAPTPKPAVVHVNKPPRKTVPAPTVRQPRGEREPGDRGDGREPGEHGHGGDD